MKRKIIVTLLFIIPISLFCQISNMALSAGYVKKGYGIFAECNFFLGKNNGDSRSKIQVAASYAKSKDSQEGVTVPYFNASVHLGYGHQVFENYYKSFVSYINIGPTVGIESINGGEKRLGTGLFVKGKNKETYGAYIGSESNYYINSDFCLTAVLNQYYVANSDIGNFLFYTGIGLRYYIN